METAQSQMLLDFTLAPNYLEDKDTVTDEKAAEDDNYIGCDSAFMYRYLAFPRLIMGLDDDFERTRNPVKSDRFGNPVVMNKAYVNQLTPGIWYVLEPQLICGFRCRYTTVDYDRADPEDSEEHKLMFQLVYNFSSTLHIDMRHHYWNRQFDDYNPDYSSNRINVAVRKQFQYFSFEADGGYHVRTFDGGETDDIEMSVCRFAFMYQIPSPPYPVPRWHFPRSYLLCAAERYLDEKGSEAEYIKTRRVSLQAGHIFLEKLTIDFSTYYQEGDFVTFKGDENGRIAQRRDKTLGFLLGSGYDIAEWLTFSFQTGYTKRESNLDPYNYGDYYFMAGIGMMYEYFSRKYTGILFEPDKRLDLYSNRVRF